MKVLGKIIRTLGVVVMSPFVLAALMTKLAIGFFLAFSLELLEIWGKA